MENPLHNRHSRKFPRKETLAQPSYLRKKTFAHPSFRRRPVSRRAGPQAGRCRPQPPASPLPSSFLRKETFAQPSFPRKRESRWAGPQAGRCRLQLPASPLPASHPKASWRHMALLVLVFAVLLPAVSCGGETRSVRGLIVDVVADSLLIVETVTVEDEDQVTWTVHGGGKRFDGFSALPSAGAHGPGPAGDRLVRRARRHALHERHKRLGTLEVPHWKDDREVFLLSLDGRGLR